MIGNDYPEKVPPIFVSCCGQNPVTINPRKLLEQHNDDVRITTTQIALGLTQNS